jgi:hypothetical protein
MSDKGFFKTQMSLVRNEWWLVIGFAAAFYLLQNAACPVGPGRDFDTYFLYYQGMFQKVAEYPYIMMLRTPITSLYYGVQNDLGGLTLIQISNFVLYVLLIAVAYSMLKKRSRLTAWVGILLIAINLNFFKFFNTTASEAVTAFSIFFWFFFSFKFIPRARIWVWVAQAFFVMFLVLIRPGHMILAIVGILPLLPGVNPGLKIGRRMVFVLTFFAVFISLETGYKAYNAARYGVSKVAVGGPAHIPFFRVFHIEKLLRPENGPRSQELHELIKEELLTREVYQTYRVDSDLFYKAGSLRSFYGIMDVVHQRDGMFSDTPILFDVAMEAHNRYPAEFWLSYLDSLRGIFGFPPWVILRPRDQIFTNYDELLKERYQKYHEWGLSIPSEGDIVPSYFSYVLLQEKDSGKLPIPDDNAIYEPRPWSWSTVEAFRPAVVVAKVMHFFHPKVGILIGLAFAGYFWGRGKKNWILFYTFGITMAMLCVSLMGLPYILYRYPFDPVITIFSVTGIHYLLMDSYISDRISGFLGKSLN